jgi:hypothetical protein
MATMLSQEMTHMQEANDTVRDFMRHFEVGKLLCACRASKSKGFSVVELLRYLLCCMFSKSSTYLSMRISSYKENFSRNTIYRFCNNARSTGIQSANSFGLLPLKRQRPASSRHWHLFWTPFWTLCVSFSPCPMNRWKCSRGAFSAACRSISRIL